MDFRFARFALSQAATGEVKTPLPQFNRLLEQFEALQRGEAIPDDVHAALAELDDVLGQMLHFFHYELQMEPDSEELAKQAPIAYDAFHRLRSSLGHLWAAEQQGHWLLFEDALRDTRRWLERLYTAMDRLRAAEPQDGAEAPLLREVLRTGRAVLEGRLGVPAFLTRVDALAQAHAPLDATLPQIPDEELRARVRESLQAELDALDGCRASAEQGDGDGLATALDLVSQAGTRLLDAERSLRAAAEREPMRLCVRCGEETPVSARYCTRCNAQLPPLQPMEASQVDLRIDDAGVQAAGGQIPENVRRVLDAADAAREGDAEPLREVVDWLAGRLADVKRRFAAMAPAPEGAPADEREAYARARQTMEEGLARMETGLDCLRAFLADGSHANLEAGVAQVTEGADHVAQVESVWKELLSARGML